MKNSQTQAQGHRDTRVYVFFGLFALILAVIINKDISIPSWLTVSLGVLVIFLLFFKGIKSPEIPFYALTAYLPFNKILSGTFGGFMTAINLTNIFIFLTFICWMIWGTGTKQEGQKKIKNIRAGFHYLVFLFCLLGVFSVMRGGFYYGSRYIMEFIVPLKRWLTPVFLYFLTFAIVRNREIFKNTVVIIMIVVAVAGLLAIKEGFDLGNAGSFDSSRVDGLAQQPNMMGAFFVYYMFLYLGFFLLNWRNYKNWMLLIPFLICFRGIQLTFSRGAYLAFAFGLAATTFFKTKAIFVILCFVGFFAILNPQFLPGGMRYAIDRTSGGEQIYDNVPFEDTLDRSAATRIEIWKGAAQMIKDNPWWGVGYGIFPYMIPMYTRGIGEMDAHNTYIIIAAEMGIFVLGIFLLIIFLLFKNTFWLFKRVKDEFIKAVALGMFGGIAGMVMANMFGSRLESEEVSAYFWILAGLIVRAVIMKKKGEII
jgi:O-antigen ligase